MGRSITVDDATLPLIAGAEGTGMPDRRAAVYGQTFPAAGRGAKKQWGAGKTLSRESARCWRSARAVGDQFRASLVIGQSGRPKGSRARHCARSEEMLVRPAQERTTFRLLVIAQEPVGGATGGLKNSPIMSTAASKSTLIDIIATCSELPRTCNTPARSFATFMRDGEPEITAEPGWATGSRGARPARPAGPPSSEPQAGL